MDSQRPKKTRSIGIDLSSPKQPTVGGHQKQEQRDKTHPAQLASRRRPSDTRQASDASKVSDKSRRVSKVSPNDEVVLQAPILAGQSLMDDQPKPSLMSDDRNYQPADRDDVPVLNLVVVGNSSVGKSVFIRNALNLRRPLNTDVASSKVILGGALYRIQLAEVSLDSVNIVSGSVSWPSIPEFGVPANVDGILCLYDVSDKDSLEGLPRLLDTLEQADKTICLVSCKVDIPLCDQEVGPNFIDQVSTRYPRIGFEEASIESSDSAKRCLLKILRETLSANRRQSRLPREMRSESNESVPRRTRRSSQNASSRSRSGSQRYLVRSRSREIHSNSQHPPPLVESEDEDSDESSTSAEETIAPANIDTKMPLRANTTKALSRIQAAKPQTPISSTENVSTRTSRLLDGMALTAPETPESYAEAGVDRRGSADTANSRKYKTFLDIDDESAADDTSPDEYDSKQTPQNTLSDETLGEGFTLAELVTRLLAMPMSKADHKFVASFLCLYRTFATPLSLLMAIIDRFVQTESSDMVVFTKTAELLRYLSVIGLWTAHYPGDFGDVAVKDTASTFLTTIEKQKSFAPSAKQIANNLQTCVPDEDLDWGFGEGGKSTRNRTSTTASKAPSRPISGQDIKPRQPNMTGAKAGQDSDSDEDQTTPSSTRYSAATSSASSLLKSSHVSSQTSDNVHHLESARERARKLRTIPQNLIGKMQWHHFMAFPTDELALEITRIDWTMYTAIRPRDFVRYVTVPSAQRSRPGYVDYISMMTKHFNHLALFISGMILVRDKPKHRAKMLEKIMDLAWKVRQMNNYHALGAIVAALNSEEIVRLSQTHELVPQEHHKQFLRLKILMSHQRSHASYRMAWENSSGERIPYLPRVQEDLTKAAVGNPTFIGSGINWKKFEVMGETIVSIQRSQEQPYSFPERTARGQDIDRLILGTKIVEGDEETADPQQELYERSKLVEPPVAATTGGERRKINWLRR